MIQFGNGITIGGNPSITKTEFGIRIQNDLGLNIEISNSVWNSINGIR
jgi:hypothetical protein